MKKLFLKRKKTVFMELIMKIHKVRIVQSLDYSEMIRMIIWQNVEQNGYIKTV